MRRDDNILTQSFKCLVMGAERPTDGPAAFWWPTRELMTANLAFTGVERRSGKQENWGKIHPQEARRGPPPARAEASHPGSSLARRPPSRMARFWISVRNWVTPLCIY
jgi:hypothetical protein